MSDPLSTSPRRSATPDSKSAAAKEEARGVANEAAASASVVGGVAKEEASVVAQEAAYQAKDLLHQSRQELMDQAAVQQARAAEGLRSIHRELSSMASNSDHPGVGTDLVRQAAERTGHVAEWLDRRDPGSLLQEVKTYARRRPGAFLAIAAGAGLLAGRLSRSLAANASEDSPESAPGRYTTGVAAVDQRGAASPPRPEYDPLSASAQAAGAGAGAYGGDGGYRESVYAEQRAYAEQGAYPEEARSTNGAAYSNGAHGHSVPTEQRAYTEQGAYPEEARYTDMAAYAEDEANREGSVTPLDPEGPRRNRDDLR